MESDSIPFVDQKYPNKNIIHYIIWIIFNR